MNAFGFGASRLGEAALKVEGIGRLILPRRAGAYLVHKVAGEDLEAVQFAPAGAPEDAVFAEAAEAFVALGERLQALDLAAGPKVLEVIRAVQGVFWLQAPAGLTLDAWLAEHPAPPAVVVEAFARRLAAALAELHAQGLTHGDLSPRTVAVEDGEVRLLLPAVDRRGFFRVLRSQSGLVEPGYAPPEAHDGARRQPIDPAADLYGASALLVRLLTGQTPAPATAIARLARGAAWDDALAGSPMQAGIEAGMALSPADRPADAASWLAGLNLPAETDEAAWFEGAARSSELAIPPPPSEPAPSVDALALDEAEPVGPIVPEPTGRAQRRLTAGAGSSLLIACAIVTVAAAAGAAVWLRPLSKPTLRPAVTSPSVVPPPLAPTGCQWAAAPEGGAGWRLRCADEAGVVRLPDRFDTQTATFASHGDVAAMERLGAFYRLRAAVPKSANRAAWGDQAYAWLARAADSNPTGRPEDDRARDDAALALGEMFGRGEGGRAIDPTVAEARLREAAAGSRADAVLALAQLLRANADQDPATGADRLAEARRLFSRVAQLAEDSPLRSAARQALSEIDAARAAAEQAAAAKAAEAARIEAAAKLPPPPPPKPVDKPKPVAQAAAAKPAAKPTPKPAIVLSAKAREVIGQARDKLTAAKDAAVKAVQPPPPKPAAKAPAKPLIVTRRTLPAPAYQASPPPPRDWTARTFVRIEDPMADFTFEVQEAGHAACEAEGGYAASVRGGEVICPNGVNYCQVRVAAVCRGLGG